ncbi:MAG: hypothetical protein DWQ35_15760 [Planctomycetota bacterium]|nr:MAG: hypothetical protein DWQ35_15760 [Planctomycetota bacterium]REK18310.1 MAG: hypothetical protein DWQ42_20755 [Planctomycetota bacterium]
MTDLSGWDRLPERHEPLPGQMSLFDVDTLEPSQQEDSEEIFGLVGDPELFETGRDLPGAAERSQRILWEVK